MVGPDVNRPFAADHGQPKIGLFEAGFFDAGKRPDRAIGQAKHCVDRVAGYEADSLRPLDGIGLRDELTGLSDRGLAPLRLAADVDHQVKHMAAEHPEILAASAVILLAPGPDLEHLTDPAGFDQVAGHQIRGGVAVDEGEAELCLGLGAGGDHGVGLGRCPHEGLLHEDALRSRLGRGDRHVGMAVEIPRADGHDVGLHGGEHLPPVVEGVGVVESMPFGGSRQPGRVVVGSRHHLCG